MGQTILSKGRSIIEAIETGLSLLGTDRDEVSIEVIRQETKGFLKIGARQAVVKLTKNKKPQNQSKIHPPEPDMAMIESMLDHLEKSNNHTKRATETNLLNNESAEVNLEDVLAGKAWVKDGQIFCQPSDTHYPTISFGKGVRLFKNGKHVTGTAVAAKDDQFSLQTEEETTEAKWKVEMDADRLHVHLFVEPGIKRSYKIKDVEPASNVHIETEERLEVSNEIKYKDILKRLEDLKVVHGFNHSEIMKAVNTESAGMFTIASGVKAKAGENGKLEILVNTDKIEGPRERTDGTIDYREKVTIPIVQKGQVIAMVHPPKPGIPGTTVTNEPLPPKQTFPLIIQSGKGIELIENDTKIVAAETGRPVIEQNGLFVKVSIIPKLVHSMDVSMMSGNIRFKGDIDIQGNVEEGMVVEGGGHITVFKNVYSASISSNSGVAIKGNAIKSSISAGNQNIFTSEMVILLNNIREKTQKMNVSIGQIMDLPAFKTTDLSKNGLFPIIRLLLNKKYQDLFRLIKQYIQLCENGHQLIDRDWLTIAERLKHCFLSSNPNEYHTVNALKGLQKEIADIIEKHQGVNEGACFVDFQYALNSTIYSSGNVTVKGQGCYNSKIHSGGLVTVNGIFRGGEIYARLGARIKESGSSAGVASKIIVPGNGMIQIDCAKEGTVIQIGKVKYTFHNEKKGIIAKLNNEGRIIF